MALFWKLPAAGFAATAITYGPARVGFGLFLPEFRSDFPISPQTAGLISSLGFFGFFAGLLFSQAMTARKGPRLPVVAGLVLATLGTGIAAAASTLPVLALGVSLAMTSAGFSWTPFNNAVHRQVADVSRPVALSAISTGTSFGVVVAGVAALLMGIAGISWRACWAAFAIGSALSLFGNWIALKNVAGSPGPGPLQPWRALLRGPVLPLFGTALCFGITSAVYITFAADRVAEAGGAMGFPANASGSLIFIAYGVVGLSGLFTKHVKDALGLPWLLRLLMLASALSLTLVALMPTHPVGLVLSAGLQGVHVMMTSAVLAFWSEQLFPDLPSQSFTAVILVVAAGSVFGPATAGFFSDAVGSTMMFLGVAALATASALAVRSDQIRERYS